MTPFHFLKNHIYSYLAPSSVHGLGLFALRDINKGVDIFRKWDGETNIYSIKFREAKLLPKDTLQLVLRSFASNIVDDESEVNFRLINGVHFLLSEPLCFLNTAYENGNIDSTNGIAIRDIKRGEELLGNYGKSSQII